MELNLVETNGEYLFVVLNNDGELVESFARQDEEAAYNFFLSLLSPEELAAEEQYQAATEAIWAMQAEDLANRRLGYTN
jgi:hypothetical protein